MSLVLCVEGHHQTHLPLHESLTSSFVVMTTCKPVFEGLMLQFCIFYCSGALAMIHLSCRPTPLLSVSQPQHIWAIDLLRIALTGSHRQMCPWHMHMMRMVLSVGWECMYLCFTRHDLMMNSSFKPLRIYKTVFKTSHLYIGSGHSTVPAPSRAMPLLGSFYP